MEQRMRRWLPWFMGVALWWSSGAWAVTRDPLPSWNPSDARQAIMGFVATIIREGSPDYMSPAERIAVFDNDGTLWAEQPMYVQLAFTLDRIRQLAPQHPEWQTTQPYRAALAGDFKTLAAGGAKSVLELLMVTHAGMTTDAFESLVRNWLAHARDPRFNRPYTELTYQPMRELLDYLRAHGFKTYVVSGGGAKFMRPWIEQAYGIPPEQVIGSRLREQFEVRDGQPAIVRQPEIDFIDDKAGKPIGIHQHIGRRPILAFGNSDGDFEMLEWTTAGPGRRLGLIVRHDDADREWSYDRESPVGRLARALDEAPARGWIVTSMKRDWKRVFAFQPTMKAAQLAGSARAPRP